MFLSGFSSQHLGRKPRLHRLAEPDLANFWCVLKPWALVKWGICSRVLKQILGRFWKNGGMKCFLWLFLAMFRRCLRFFGYYFNKTQQTGGFA